MTPLGSLGDLSHLVVPKPEKPTVVFIPGAFHTAAHFGPLSRYLETHDCESFAISLPSITGKAGMTTPGMAEDVAAIRGVLEELVWDKEGGDKADGEKDANDTDDHEEQEKRNNDDDDDHQEKSDDDDNVSEKPRPIERDPGKKDVVLVMHASGAAPACQAITDLERSHRIKDGKKGGIISLFFIGGLLVEEGETLGSTMERLGGTPLPAYAEIDGPILRPINATSHLYRDLPPEKAAYWTSQLSPQSASVYTTAVQNTCWELDVPVTYVRCAKDAELQIKDAMVAKMRRAHWDVRTIEAGCSPFLSCVEEVGDLVLEATQPA